MQKKPQNPNSFKNLIPSNMVSKEEAVKRARMGGIKAAALKKERATFKMILNELLALSNDGEQTNKEAIALKVIERAKQGDLNATEIIIKNIGEEQTSKLEIANLPIINDDI